jgi:glycosyltransferase involved in cell wall biosynthesis
MGVAGQLDLHQVTRHGNKTANLFRKHMFTNIERPRTSAPMPAGHLTDCRISQRGQQMNSFSNSRQGPNNIKLSLVIPIFNEEAVFDQLKQRLIAALPLLPASTEVLLVNDGSSDATGPLIRELCLQDEHFVGVHLTRNFGHQMAMCSGLELARGEAVAVLDGDLQDPPEILPAFYAKLQEGYDVVYAIRQKRKESIPKRLLYWGFYRLMAALTPIEIPLDTGDFGIMSRRVVDALNAMPERRRFVRGMRCYVGFRQTGLAYERHQRAGGQPKYTWRKLLMLAADGIFTFSEIPLRLATLTGLCSAAFSIFYAVYLLIQRIFVTYDLPGFATLAVGLFFLGGVQLICMGILGEYIGRIHNEVKQRPPYIVERVDRKPVEMIHESA